jgi:hypothetical protein
VSRLTLRLPETLHQQLAHLAEDEGVSLNQYIVYALTRQAVLVHEIQVTPEADAEEQKKAFQSLLKQLGQASISEIESVLAARDQVDAETELSTDAVAHLQERIRKRA